jgi:sugar phosphate isomerase/epimerase
LAAIAIGWFNNHLHLFDVGIKRPQMTKPPIALQLYAVRDACAANLPGTLKRISEIGYEGVEFAGYYDHSAAELRKMLESANLQVAGAHVPTEQLLGDELDKTIEFHKTLGNKFLIVPWLGDYVKGTRASWLEAAHLLNSISEKLAPHGLFTGYHNHGIEFTEIDGETPWDTFFGNTHPEVVMQIDVGNALQMGGADAVPYLDRYPGRARTVHLKDYSADNQSAIIGEGSVRWADIFKVCETTAGTEWYIVEQEVKGMDSLQCADQSRRALRKMGR